MGSLETPMHTVRTTLNYYLPPSKGGTTVYYPGTASDKRRKHQPREVDVTDIRGREADFSLDVQGFQVVEHESREKTFDNDERIKQDYYPECAAVVKQITGATSVHAVSHVVRKRTFDKALEEEKDLKDSDIVGGATTARFIHVDQSNYGAQTRLRDYLPLEEVDRLTRTRWAIINLWRPFGRPVEREPLAVCDARTVSDSDLRAVKGIMPPPNDRAYLKTTGGRDIELWHVLPPEEGAQNGDKHKWYYCSGLKPDEALLVKQFDSKKDGRARRVPHTAFASAEDRGPPRQSLEVRCLVFWEGQECE